MQMSINKHVGTTISEEKWHNFTLACVKQNTKKAKVIRDAIDKFIKESESVAR